MKKSIILLLMVFSFTGFGQRAGIAETALQNLVQKAEAAHSDGLVIYQNGQLVGEWYFGKKPRRVDIKSVTKSISNLGIGVLVSRGKLSLDQKVLEFFPEWKQEGKQDITIRHLLAHTSGLLDSDFELVETAPDAIAMALASDLTHPVGKYHVYNNKAVNLLAGIAKKADGRPLDQIVAEEIFQPLGISDFFWRKDQTGNPYCMAFLEMLPHDLAKVGLLVWQKGQWGGRQLIDAEWFDWSLVPAEDFMPEYGLLWELKGEGFRFVVDERQLKALEAANLHPDFLAKTQQMKGTYEGYRPFYQAVSKTFGKDWASQFQYHLYPTGLHLGRKEMDKQSIVAGIGYLGQYLVICPESGLVAVRLIRHYDEYDFARDEWMEFPYLIEELSK